MALSCKKKSLTDPRHECKKHIMEKIFVTRLKNNILVNYYVAVLLVFKSFILVFKQKHSMVHFLRNN